MGDGGVGKCGVRSAECMGDALVASTLAATMRYYYDIMRCGRTPLRSATPLRTPRYGSPTRGERCFRSRRPFHSALRIPHSAFRIPSHLHALPRGRAQDADPRIGVAQHG